MFEALRERLQAVFAGGVDQPMDDGAFNALALDLMAYQFSANSAFRGFCLGRGVEPGSVTTWEQVPAVPTTAFKFVDLASGPTGSVEATFLTSGTTSGQEVRGRHPVPSLELYRASALPNLQAHLNPGGGPLQVLSLIPSPELAPESSLSAMMGFAADAWGDPVRWLAHPVDGPDVGGFITAVQEAGKEDRPALVAGTAFALVHLLDDLARRSLSLSLPQGSRLMETGGFKGRSREVERDELYAGLEQRLGIPRVRMVNEYGMTELLSQLYEAALREGWNGRRVHVPPPWLRVRALHPDTLEPVGPSEPGLLAFFDLANLGSVCHVLTQDVGMVDGEGVTLMGRSQGAEPRGCSLALEEFLGARGDGGAW